MLFKLQLALYRASCSINYHRSPLRLNANRTLVIAIHKPCQPSIKSFTSVGQFSHRTQVHSSNGVSIQPIRIFLPKEGKTVQSRRTRKAMICITLSLRSRRVNYHRSPLWLTFHNNSYKEHSLTLYQIFPFPGPRDHPNQ